MKQPLGIAGRPLGTAGSGDVQAALSPQEVADQLCHVASDLRSALRAVEENTALVREGMRDAERHRKKIGEAMDHLDGLAERMDGNAEKLVSASAKIEGAADRFVFAVEALARALAPRP